MPGDFTLPSTLINEDFTRSIKFRHKVRFCRNLAFEIEFLDSRSDLHEKLVLNFSHRQLSRRACGPFGCVRVA